MAKYTNEQLVEIAESALEKSVAATAQLHDSPSYSQAVIDGFVKTGNLALDILAERKQANLLREGG